MNIYCNDTKNSKADPLGPSVLTTDRLRLNRQEPHKGNYTLLASGIFAIANGNNKPPDVFLPVVILEFAFLLYEKAFLFHKFPITKSHKCFQILVILQERKKKYLPSWVCSSSGIILAGLFYIFSITLLRCDDRSCSMSRGKPGRSIGCCHSHFSQDPNRKSDTPTGWANASQLAFFCIPASSQNTRLLTELRNVYANVHQFVLAYSKPHFSLENFLALFFLLRAQIL